MFVGARQAVVCAFLLTATVARAGLPGAASDTWVEVKSERFTVLTNAGSDAAATTARRLERLASVLEQTIRGLRVDGKREVRVYLFRDFDSFKPYREYGDDEHGTTAGYQVVGPDADLIAFHVPSDGSATKFAAHEYIHAVVRRNVPRLPLWANEGLAEYYSTIETSANTADIGRPIPTHMEWLREHPVLPLDELLEMDTNSPDYHVGVKRGTFYAQSWALVHMLERTDDPAAPRFLKLLTAYRRGRPNRTALLETYGAQAMDSLAQALERYRMLPSLTYSSLKFAEDFRSVAVTERTLSRVEAVAALGELATYGGPKLTALAREHLQAAWAMDSTHTVTAALFAELADRDHNTGETDGWIAAVERRGDSPRASGIAGRLLAMRPYYTGWSPSFPAAGAPAAARRARALLETALAGAPETFDWQLPYGLTFLEDSAGVAPGREALFNARNEQPQNAPAAGGLGMLEVRIGNRAGATALYQTLPSAGPDQAWRGWLGYLIARHAMREALARFGAGQAAAAESLLVALQRDITEADVARNTRSLLDWMKTARPRERAPDVALAPQRGSVPNASRRGPGGEPGAAGAGDSAAGTTGGSGSGAASGGGGGASAGPGGAGASTGPGAASGGGRAPQAPASRVSRAMQAARAGDYQGAEQLLELERASRPASGRAAIDPLLSEVRNQRRMGVAKSLAASGRAFEACVLWRQILEDHPKPDVRALAEKQVARFCGGAR